MTVTRLPRSRVRSPGFLCQPLPFGRFITVSRSEGCLSVYVGRKTSLYPEMPQYQKRGLTVRWWQSDV